MTNSEDEQDQSQQQEPNPKVQRLVPMGELPHPMQPLADAVEEQLLAKPKSGVTLAPDESHYPPMVHARMRGSKKPPE